MAEGCEKEVVIPLGLEHFVADARRTGCGLQDVEDQLTDKGEIFRRVILAAAAGVLVKQDVENPVKVVLDAPVGAHDLEQLLGWQQARGKKVIGPCAWRPCSRRCASSQCDRRQRCWGSRI